MIKIAKFGGSSVANAQQFQKVKTIVHQDPSRRFIVTSAIGKAQSSDHKLTDLLYLFYAHKRYNVSGEHILQLIRQRLVTIKQELQLETDIEKELDLFFDQLKGSIEEDYLVSRGEYLTALLLSEYLGFPFVDAKDLIFFHYDGSFNYEKIQSAFDSLIKTHSSFVLPGFYGA
ncbi:MAG: aspartate kinase, partial [Clostridiales bacterium]|nr:aspartate kinase [Clostridiales bacterium]